MSESTRTITYHYGIPDAFDTNPDWKNARRENVPDPMWEHTPLTWSHKNLVVDQMRLAHEYRNALADEERNRRKKIDGLAKVYYPELDNINKAITNLWFTIEEKRKQIKNKNNYKQGRTATEEDKEILDLMFTNVKALYAEKEKIITKLNPPIIKNLLKQRKDLLKKYKLYNKLSFGKGPEDILEIERQIKIEEEKHYSGNPDIKKFKDAMNAIDKASYEQCKHLQHNNKLHWGTYLIVDEFASKFRKGMPPAPNRKWTGEGNIGIQYHNGIAIEDFIVEWPEGMSVEDLLKLKKSRLYIGKDKRTFLVLPQSIPGKIRENGKPERSITYVGFPIFYHRKLKPGTMIQWIKVSRQKTGPNYYWNVDFVVREEVPEANVYPHSKVVVKYNWELLPNIGLKVASYLGSDGSMGNLVLHHRYYQWRQEHIDILNKGRSDIFTKTSSSLKFLLNEIKNFYEIPNWLFEKFSDQECFKIKENGEIDLATEERYPFHALYFFWKNNRFEGDSELFGALDSWFRLDKKAWTKIAHLYKKMKNYKKACFRKFAATLCGYAKDTKGYHTIVVPDQKFEIRNPSPEDKKSFPALRFYKKLLSFGELSLYLKQKANKLEKEKSESISGGKKSKKKKNVTSDSTTS